jgi:hypothetical protein
MTRKIACWFVTVTVAGFLSGVDANGPTKGR